MRNIEGTMREAMQIVSLEEAISKTDEVRVIDEIVEQIDFEKLGYQEKTRKSEAGRPKYDEKKLTKLYLYGYRYGIHSGQRLEDECKYNVRVQWLLEKNMPDKNTINAFRSEQKEFLKNLLYEVNRIFIEIKVLKINQVSQDGFKIKASNNKDKNYTVNKLVDRIRREEEAIKRYEEAKEKLKIQREELRKRVEKEEVELEEIEELNELENEIAKIEEQQIQKIKAKGKHEAILKEMEKRGESQISETDPDSRLMKNNGKFEVCYNNQTAVDIKSHMTVAYETDNNPADLGTMNNLMKKIKEEYKEEVEIIENVTDKGYNDREDMAKCLEEGTIAYVTPLKEGEEQVELETEYEEAEISEEMLESTKREDIKKCIRAGKIPKCYAGKIEKIEVVEKREYKEEVEEPEDERSDEEIRDEAIRNGTFERNKKRGIVYCPMGESLGKKSQKKDGTTCYANKLACERCKNPCTSGKYKEIGMKAHQIRVYPRGSVKTNQKKKRKIERKRKVLIRLKLDQELIKKRMQTSEHSQGTMKTVGNHSSFSMRGKSKVSAEVGIYFAASNIRRACNILTIEKLLLRLRKRRHKLSNNNEIMSNNHQINLTICENRALWYDRFKECMIKMRSFFGEKSNFWLTWGAVCKIDYPKNSKDRSTLLFFFVK